MDSNKSQLYERFFTVEGRNPLDEVEWIRTTANAQGEQVEVLASPKNWSPLAVDIAVGKYFKRTPSINDGKGENSIRDLIQRICDTVADQGEIQGYFDAETKLVFRDELYHIVVNQLGSFNSPVWFNCGLKEKYGMEGSASNNHHWDAKEKAVVKSKDYFTRPQLSACFIQSVEDDMEDIAAQVAREMRIFKGGSGSGTNFSSLRGKGEPLSTGGTSSGVMSFLKIYDVAAGSTKSGGTNRRAAKMVILDADHPEIMEFINWKAKEENKARVLIAAGFSADFEGEAYSTISGQNSNNSIRVTDDFMDAVLNDGDWDLKAVKTGNIVKTLKARDIMKAVADAAWQCADPGIQFHTTINDWNTVPKSGEIRASNPCVTGDTLVATRDGWRRIDEIVGTTQWVKGADGLYHHVKDIFYTGSKPVITVKTKAGYELRMTEEHVVKTKNRGGVPASGLVSGDVVLLQGAGFGTENLENGFATILGLLVGDGCISADGYASLTMDPAERPIVEASRDTINEIKTSMGGSKASIGEPVEVQDTATSVKVVTGCKYIVNLFKRWAVLDEKSIGKRFTDEIYRLDRDSMAAVLRGLFTADGTVANYGEKSQYVSLDSTSLELLKQVQKILLSFDIKAKIYPNRRDGNLTAELPDGRGGLKEYDVNEMHSLRISRSSRIVFEREIGFHPTSHKNEQLRNMNETVGVYADRFEDEIDTISQASSEEPVYDLTESETHHFVANGIIVHNCSEYLGLDDSACNLASINLTAFLNDDDSFNIEAFKHVCRTLILAQDIIIDYASYPTPKICENSHNLRALGLGYTNLGGLLMRLGVAYDSDQGRSIAAAITAIMTATAYTMSAKVAEHTEPFAHFKRNKSAMLKVIDKHRRAAYSINEKLFPEHLENLFAASSEAWDEALEVGKKNGYRNSQVSLLAPTGTISFQMDAETTGVEPDYALVKFKKFAGGGATKIVNSAVLHSLAKLGYSEQQIQDMKIHLLGSGSSPSTVPRTALPPRS